MAGRFKDLIGKQFGKLEVVSRVDSDKRGALWNCMCDCGKTVERTSAKLNSGPTCGCNITIYNHEEERKSGIKTCRTCKIEKPFSDYPVSDKPNGIAHDCKSCQSMKTKLKFFGITQDEFHKLREDACHCCQICGITEQDALKNNNKTKHYGLYIDHDHTTNKVRGMLCHNCNLIIGHAKDSTILLLAAAKYLEGSNYGNKTKGS